MKNFAACCLLLLCTLLTLVCYWHGLNGPFLFDDAPNLQAMGDLGGVRDWATLKAFVLSGWSGPTGRPLSLLSFLIDDSTWPSTPWPFKYTNLMLHLMCGLLLAWASYLLLLAARWADEAAAWIAVLSASIWLLHPFMMSTTLYVVQRMTVLSTLFMLVGMVGYLKGRLWLMHGQKTALQAHVLMSVAVGFGTLLAVLSKENGALLPMLLLVLEAYLRRTNAEAARPWRWWTGAALVLPSAAVIVYLASQINFSAHVWPTRPFDQVERLYSESRIVWDYLGQLWMPQVEGFGLFQDGFLISRGLLHPITTLWAILAWVALLLSSPWLYRRLPMVWLALTFFLCGHLIESTVIGLELIFEHRNYGPSLFMFLPLAAGVHWLGRKHGRSLAIFATAGIITLLASLTWQRSQLWADGGKLQTYWAAHSPQSARGKNYFLGRLVNEKKYGEALAYAQQVAAAMPDSSLLTIGLLRIQVNTGQATAVSFETAAKRLAAQPFDAQTIAGLRILVDDITAVSALTHYSEPMLDLLAQLSREGPYHSFPLFIRFAAYSEARLYLAQGNANQAFTHYELAIQRYGQATAAMQMFAEMASSGHTAQAHALLRIIEQGIATGTLDTKPLGKDYYEAEITRMRAALAESE